MYPRSGRRWIVPSAGQALRCHPAPPRPPGVRRQQAAKASSSRPDPGARSPWPARPAPGPATEVAVFFDTDRRLAAAAARIASSASSRRSLERAGHDETTRPCSGPPRRASPIAGGSGSMPTAASSSSTPAVASSANQRARDCETVGRRLQSRRTARVVPRDLAQERADPREPSLGRLGCDLAVTHRARSIAVVSPTWGCASAVQDPAAAPLLRALDGRVQVLGALAREPVERTRSSTVSR